MTILNVDKSLSAWLGLIIDEQVLLHVASMYEWNITVKRTVNKMMYK